MTTDHAAAIKRLLEREGITAAELARRAGMHRQVLSNMLTGRRRITPASLVRLYGAVGQAPPAKLLMQAAQRAPQNAPHKIKKH